MLAQNIARFLLETVAEGAVHDARRQAFFSDKTITNGDVPGPGDATDYDIYNGIFTQLEAIVTADPSANINITENEGASKAAQELGDGAALAYFEDAIYSLDPRVRNPMILSTRSMYLNYMKSLTADAGTLESARTAQIQGVRDSQVVGVPLIEMQEWDEVIREDFDNGTTWVNPHRFILTSKANLALGIDDYGAIGSFETWYEKKDEEYNIRGDYKVDTMVVRDEYVKYGV